MTYAVERAEEVEAGDDEVGESEAVDLLGLVLVGEELVHHLQVSHVLFSLERLIGIHGGGSVRRRQIPSRDLYVTLSSPFCYL